MSITKQQIFDKVVAHARSMTRLSSDDSSGASCMYRDPHGGRCFAGALIPDSAYHPGLEGTTFEALFNLDPASRLPRWMKTHKSFIRDLQEIHDCYSRDCWGIELRRVANDHDLSTKSMGRFPKTFAKEQP